MSSIPITRRLNIGSEKIATKAKAKVVQIEIFISIKIIHKYKIYSALNIHFNYNIIFSLNISPNNLDKFKKFICLFSEKIPDLEKTQKTNLFGKALLPNFKRWGDTKPLEKTKEGYAFGVNDVGYTLLGFIRNLVSITF